jgi:single-strand DNA-binding protein
LFKGRSGAAEIYLYFSITAFKIQLKGEVRMPSLNHIVLIGRLARDPELRHTTAGTAVANFTLAVDRRPRADGTKEADFIRVITWGKQGETCANYLAKGRLVAVDGCLQVRAYEGKDGLNHTTSEVIADNVQFLSPKKISIDNGSDEAISADAEVTDDEPSNDYAPANNPSR